MAGRRWAAFAAAVALFFGTAAVAIAQTSGPEPVTCLYDGSTLSCPLPQQTVTETASTTAIVTADPITVFTTATATTTVNPPTVTAPGRTVTVTRTTTRTVTATPSTSSSTKPATSSQPATSPAPAAPASPTSATPAARLNCAANPSACGYPDATNTGAKGTLTAVPGTAKSGAGWTYSTSSGCIEVRTDGAVLDSLDVAGCVEIYASHVTIKNTRVTSSGEWWGIGLRDTTGTTIQDTTVRATPGGARLLVAIKDVTGSASSTQVLRSDISGVSTGIQTHEGLIQDNYVHDLRAASGDHVNGTTSNGSTVPLTIRHNTVLNPLDQADAISLFEDFGQEANRTIDNNLVAGGSYSIYAGQNAGGPTAHDIKVTNNRVSRMYFPNGGTFGPVAAYNNTAPGNVFTGNVWDDTGATIPTP